MATEGTERIGNLAAVSLIGFAIAVDAIQILFSPLPFIAALIAIIANIGLMVWFAVLRVSFTEGKAASKRFITFATMFLAEFASGVMPFLAIAMLCGTTMGVGLIIYFTRKEDKEKAAAALVAQQTQAANTNTPQGSRRRAA